MFSIVISNEKPTYPVKCNLQFWMLFDRLTAHFLIRMGQGELRKQWSWEPRMGESLILSLVDPNDVCLIVV